MGPINGSARSDAALAHRAGQAVGQGAPFPIVQDFRTVLSLQYLGVLINYSLSEAMVTVQRQIAWCATSAMRFNSLVAPLRINHCVDIII